uniref:neutral/alkaline non-lysosomal ceramidase N-terminal domain-containing protein n=1 Tax=Patulibacter defluvii TaxID=3095358 RepID=UPI002A7546EE
AVAERRARAARRTAAKRRRSARAWAGRPCARDGRQPLGAWTSFANHGTVVKSEYGLYSADHGGVAAQQLEARIRAAAGVPADQTVIAVYGSADQGDQSAGLDHSGPAGADFVGRAEGDAMFRAWQQAGAGLSPTPELTTRWTRFCFCGRATSDGGRVATKPVIGLPFLTGSEEGRGPLYDALGVPFEGVRAPSFDGVQGNKVGVPIGEWSSAWPMALVRVGDGAIVTVPGEPTVGVGELLKDAVLTTTRPAGVRRAVVAGLVNDYFNYVTTPAEYDLQQYEGGSTVFGRHQGIFLKDRATELGQALAGRPVTLEQVAYDASNGVRPNGPAYAAGAASGRIVAQPSAIRRLGHATLEWEGGPRGADLPVDRAFLTAERQDGDRWIAVDNDLGSSFAWTVDDGGRYRATWEPPVNAVTGRYRLVVSAARYRLVSAPFAVSVSDALEARPHAAPAGKVAVQVGFPVARVNVDLTARPSILSGGSVRFRVGGRDVEAPIGRDGVAAVTVPAGGRATIPAGAIRDADGNVNGREAGFNEGATR